MQSILSGATFVTDEIKPLTEKEKFLDQFASLRPDLMFPDSWTPEQREQAVDMTRSSRVTHNMFASIPMKCDGPRCPFAAVCEFQKKNMAPVGNPCPIEMAIVKTFMDDYMVEFGVSANNRVEVGQIRDLVDQEVQYMRKVKILAQEHFIQENPVGIDSDGNVILRKELHQAVDFEDRIHKRKERLLNQFLATREARVKAGQGQLDAAQAVANLMDNVRVAVSQRERLLRQALGMDEVDEYIEADLAAEEADAEDV